MAIVYLTTNLINGKKYIGVDGQNNPKYLGSGKYLKKAITKYGVSNFKKEILFEFNTETEAYLKEIELIAEHDAVNSSNYYNIHPGGDGGWNHFSTKGPDNPMYGKSVKDKFILKYGEELGNKLYSESRRRAGIKTSEVLKGKPKSDKHKKSLSIAKKNFWKNLTEDEKVLRRKQMSENMKSANIVRSDEYKQKMSTSIKENSYKIHKKVKCQVCGKEMNPTNLKRWHGEKCKSK